MNQDDKNKKSFWGDLGDLEKVPTPKTHLKEQADILTQVTKYVLQGEVTQEVSPEGTFTFKLDIIARHLNNYRHSILLITHGIELYPLNLYDCVNDRRFECKDEENFLIVLRAVLSSASVRKVISSLISQSKA